jgi:hypothetical protein
MTYGVCSLAGHDPVEGLIAGRHLVKSKSILRSVSVKMMFRLLPSSMRVPVNYWIDDQRVGPGVRDVYPMIFPGESDRELRPTQRLRIFGVDMSNLPCV